MSRAKNLIEFMNSPVAPAAPGTTRPATAPVRTPIRKPSTNPFRRKDIRPNEAPRPKANMESAEAQLLAQIRERFITERVSGFVSTNGKKVEPVSREAATRRWESVEPQFRETIATDSEIRERHGLDISEGGFKSSEKATMPGKAKKMISGKSSGKGASGLTAKKAFKK